MGLRGFQAQKKWVIVRTKTQIKLMNQHNALPLGYEASLAAFSGLCHALSQLQTAEHHTLEAILHRQGQHVLRQVLKDTLKLRTQDACGQIDGTYRLQTRQLESSFGTVPVGRPARLRPGEDSERSLDAELNLPAVKYSHFFQKRLCQEAACRSYDEALAQLDSSCAGHLPKRQAEAVVIRCAKDFEAFYQLTCANSVPLAELLIGSLDGTAVTMRPEGLREKTRKKAQAKRPNRLGKPSHTRTATVAAVYSLAPQIRTAADILAQRKQIHVPRPVNKRVWATLERPPNEVVKELFAEMIQRDPAQHKTWVILVDGGPAQRKQVEAEARRQGLQIVVVMDVIHVLEYLWKAAYCFYDEGSEMAQKWVTDQFGRILEGQAGSVAGVIRRKATLLKLAPSQRKGVDACARYLSNHKAYLRYDVFLAAGFPMATGVIEGACRYLVKDRMDRTGARWGLPGAEAVLKLRSLQKTGDFEAYWEFHLEQEKRRIYGKQSESKELSRLEAA